MENTNDYITQDTLLKPNVYQELLYRAKADPELKRQRDIKNALLVAPAVAGISEASRVLGGGGVNLNPLLKFAAYQPGANKEQLLDMASTPHKSPGDIMAGLLNLAAPGVKAHEQYQKDRDKFFATQMGRPVGAAGFAQKAALARLGHEQDLERDAAKQGFRMNELQAKLAFEKMLTDMEMAHDRELFYAGNNKDLQKELKKDNKEAQKQLRGMAKTYAASMEIYQTLDSMSQIFTPHVGTGDLPGIGQADFVPKSAFDAMAMKLKDYYDRKVGGKSEEFTTQANEIRQMSAKLINLKNRLINSARATDKDYIRTLFGEGFGLFQTEKQALDTVRKLRDVTAQVMQLEYEAMSDTAKTMYDSKNFIDPYTFGSIKLPTGTEPITKKKKKQTAPPPEAPPKGGNETKKKSALQRLRDKNKQRNKK